ncbi:MAG: hypothetical protein Q4G03_11605 [Planctomycetia bacterium]|nr:hypothetical protein [Planctomycetia bacterium]
MQRLTTLSQQARLSQRQTVVRPFTGSYKVQRNYTEVFQCYYQQRYEDALYRLLVGSRSFPISNAEQFFLDSEFTKYVPSGVWKLPGERSIDFVDQFFSTRRPRVRGSKIIELRVTTKWINALTATKTQAPCEDSQPVERHTFIQVKKIAGVNEQHTRPEPRVFAQVKQAYEPRWLDHHFFRYEEPVVDFRKDMVTTLFDYRKVILDGIEGSCNYDMPQLEGVPISAIISKGDCRSIKITRRLGDASITIDTSRSAPSLTCRGKGRLESFDLANLLPDYQKNYWHYYGGAWFEEFVYHTLKANRTVQKLALRYYVNVHRVAREIDVIAFSSGCYYLLSCKTGRPKKEDIAILNDEVKMLHRNVSRYQNHQCKGILCYARDVDMPNRFRHCNLSCVSGGSLGEILRDRLIDLQPGVVYK